MMRTALSAINQLYETLCLTSNHHKIQKNNKTKTQKKSSTLALFYIIPFTKGNKTLFYILFWYLRFLYILFWYLRFLYILFWHLPFSKR